MAPEPETPRRHARGGKRVAKKNAAVASSESPSVPADPIADAAAAANEAVAFKPTHILKRGEAATLPAADPATTANPQIETTPPTNTHVEAEGRKPLPQEASPSGNNSAADTPKPRQKSKSKPKTTPAKPVQTRSHNGPSKPVHETPKSKSKYPAFFTESPSKAYAGPGFHASPDASSLPLPKFLSQSVPNVDKTTSLKNMMSETDSSESSPSEDEPSPSKHAAIAKLDRQTREDSPLDIFFRADKESKLRVPQSALNTGRMNSQGNPTVKSGALNGPRPVQHNHVRHLTDSSNPSMFPMEMEASTPQPRIATVPSKVLSENRTVSESANAPRKDLNAADLMMLLNVSQPSAPLPAPENYSPLKPSTPSPSQRSKTGSRSSARLSGTPPIFPGGLDRSPEERQAALVALAEKQIAMPNGYTPSGLSSQRPATSSGLRKEMSISSSPSSGRVPELPSSSTPTHTYATRASTAAKPRPTPAEYSMPSQKADEARQPVNGYNHNLKSMEDDLRKILKLV